MSSAQPLCEGSNEAAAVASGSASDGGTKRARCKQTRPVTPSVLVGKYLYLYAHLCCVGKPPLVRFVVVLPPPHSEEGRKHQSRGLYRHLDASIADEASKAKQARQSKQGRQVNNEQTDVKVKQALFIIDISKGTRGASGDAYIKRCFHGMFTTVTLYTIWR
jgi:hypothetical protein